MKEAERERQLELYKKFLTDCTSSNSINNLTNFKRINECIGELCPDSNDISILDFNDPVDFSHIEENVLNLDRFKEYDEKGKKQYSNTLFWYLRFLNAKRLFSNFLIDDSNENNNVNCLVQQQQIYYGAPGTGKSYCINKYTKGQSVVRTTFHPDSDYSTFVGAYKPITIKEKCYALNSVGETKPIIDLETGEPKEEARIQYKFIAQAFLQAYIKAWQMYAVSKGSGTIAKRQYLIIEEINRGNCAQIFGDLFQLLDRARNGFSEYPINADADIECYLAEAFDKYYFRTPSIGGMKAEDVAVKIKLGKILVLPPNLYIWATMNTSDQSLFPIDSAFKRRWDWKYVKIAEGFRRREDGTFETDAEGKRIPLGWKIKCGDSEPRDWWVFVRAINGRIASATSSDDKKLGYFFCRPKDDTGLIDEETFVGKVVFYLWNDVFKDNENTIFKISDEPGEPSFDAFYTENEAGDTVVNVAGMRRFLENVMGKETEKEEQQ